MKQRNVQHGDLRNALVEAKGCVAQRGSSWRVNGPDLDGDDLTVAVVIEDDLVVVTVF